MASHALRASFDFEDAEDRFFISGVEKAGRLRNTYEYQLRRRKVFFGALIAVGSIGLVALIIGLAWGLSRRKLDYVCPRSYDHNKTDLVFYVIGDWGRAGNANQMKVARLMADVSECMPPSFVVSTGDNFYPSGLSSASDPLFTTSFTAVYSAPGLQVPWYAVMGNHDYGDSVEPSLLSSGTCLSAPNSTSDCAGRCCLSPQWQVSAELRDRDPRWQASMGGVITRVFPLGVAGAGGGGNNTLDIIFVDTVPLIYQYEERSWSHFLNGFRSQDADTIRAQLQQHLSKSLEGGAKWRLVVGHHPVLSYGNHCSPPDSYDCIDMSFLRPLLERYRVAAYINGHDHDQQLIKAADNSVYYVVSGSGSDTREGEFDFLDGTVAGGGARDALFLSDKQGFLAVVLSGDSMRLHFYTTAQSGPTYTRLIPVPTWEE